MTADDFATVWILGDQLLREHPALSHASAHYPRSQVVVLLIEAEQRRRKHPYQRKKLVLLLSAMRHYADWLRQQGYTVDYRSAATLLNGIADHIAEYQPSALYTMAAADYSGRQIQEMHLSAITGLPVAVLPNTQFLTGEYDPLPAAPTDKPTVMENFYRRMRQHFDVLMAPDGQPIGGQWNFDAENRKPLPPSGLNPPPLPDFEPDDTTRDVMRLIDSEPHGWGTVPDFNLAVTHQQAEAALTNFVRQRLPLFGDYEDAMSAQNGTLYHSMLSPYLNLGLLTPQQCLTAAENAYKQGTAPINAVEGFVRQILGWREYIYWQYWRQMPALADANNWGFNRPLPDFFWTGKTEMRCLQKVIQRAHATGYNHHIERLMVVCNFAMLAGLNPQAVNDWFLSLYIDAYEWVMLPNVIGMGLNADGGRTATKPYIASANYINKMSDYCGGCRYDPKQRTGSKACPFNYLYWNFLLEHEEILRSSPRAGRNVLALRHLDDNERQRVRQQADEFLADLTPGA